MMEMGQRLGSGQAANSTCVLGIEPLPELPSQVSGKTGDRRRS